MQFVYKCYGYCYLLVSTLLVVWYININVHNATITIIHKKRKKAK